MRKLNIDNYILQNYKTKTNAQMALECGCNKSTISNHRKKLGISVTELNQTLRDKSSYICAQKGKKTCAQLAKELNCSKDFIKKIWQENNLTNSFKFSYSYNENYFEDINTPQKAYWLGFIAADGNLYRREGHQGLLTISVHKDDIEVVESFKQDLEAFHPIKIITDNRRENTQMASIQIVGDKIFNDLLKKGIGIRKTFDMDLEKVIFNIQTQYIPSFILGYFDGDGSIDYLSPNITKSHVRISAPIKSLKVLQSYLQQFECESNIIIDKRKYSEPFGSLEMSNTTSKYIFLQLIYYINVKCLSRKKERSIELLQAIENNITNRSENVKAINIFKSVVVKWEELLER